MLPNTFDRRDFLKLSAAGIALAGLPGLAGCATQPDREPPLDLARRASSPGNAVNTFSMHPRIKQGAMRDLQRALSEVRRTGGVFSAPSPGVHFARIALLEVQQQLVVAVIYDRSRRTAINFLVENGARLERVLQFCEGYAPGDALDPVKLNFYRRANRVHNKLFFTAYDTAEDAVRESLSVRENFLGFLRAAEGLVEDHVPYRFDRFLLENNVRASASDRARPKRLPGCIPFQPQLTNTLTMVQTLRQGRIQRDDLPHSHSRLMSLERRFGPITTYKQFFELILKEGEFAVRDLHEHPLAQLHTLHFARVAMIEGDKMLFESVYDGDFTQYVLDFGSRVAAEIDALWGLTEGYPRKGCGGDVTGFIDWMHKGQVNVGDFYSAHGNVTLLQIQAATKLQKRLEAFAASGLPVKAPALNAQLREFVIANQALLG